MQMQRTFSTAQVATHAGIHRDTLLRWLRTNLVPEPGRDRRGWRVFTEAEAHQIVHSASNGADQAVRRDHDIPFSENLDRLRAIDWDFSDAQTTYLSHSMHPYPAKFIPQISNALIQELSSVGETVADIFCGSGTALLETLLLKRNAIGIDANPLAILISRAKTAHLTEQDFTELENHIDDVRHFSHNLSPDEGDLFYEGRPFISCGPRPDPSMLEFWFMPHVVEELAELRRLIDSMQHHLARTLAQVCFSAIIVSVSKQDSDTRYVRRDKDIVVGDTIKRYLSHIRSVATEAREAADLIEPRFSCDLYHANILEEPEAPNFDLLVCSPPYPNAYSYHLYHRSRLLWLGYNSEEFKQQEIGSHRKYSRKGPSRATADTFRAEFRIIFNWIKPRLRSKRYACFVVGDSTLNGETIDNASLLSDASQEFGFREVSRLDRRIASTRKYFNPAIGKIRSEKILILQGE